MTLNELKKVLKKGKGTLYAAVLVRLAGSVLPRLSEVTGEDGGPLIIELPKEAIEKYGLNSRAS